MPSRPQDTDESRGPSRRHGDVDSRERFALTSSDHDPCQPEGDERNEVAPEKDVLAESRADSDVNRGRIPRWRKRIPSPCLPEGEGNDGKAPDQSAIDQTAGAAERADFCLHHEKQGKRREKAREAEPSTEDPPEALAGRHR